MEQGSLMPLWATPIYHNKITGDEFDEIQKELYDIIDKVKFEESQGWGAHSHQLTENAFSQNILYDNQCMKTLTFIHNCLMDYIQSVNAPAVQYIMDGAWITKTKKGKQAYPHSHGFSDISGVYYINTNGKDGNLVFTNIHDGFANNIIYNSIGGASTAPLETGLIMMWPSNLRHETQENTTDNERLSLSFNVNFARNGFKIDFGDDS